MRALRHLATRFIEVMRASALTPAEQAAAEEWLEPSERPLFWGQAPADQRHAFDAARAVAEEMPGRIDLQRAALLHDVGKRHAGLGVPGRVVASVLRLARLPAPGRLATYLDHPALGGRELDEAGAEPIVVLFALHHHQAAAPSGVEPAEWSILRRADGE